MAETRRSVRREIDRPAGPRRTGQGWTDHPIRRSGRDSDARHTAPPAAKFQPDAKTRRTQRQQILELLRERGEYGLTRLDFPHLGLSMPARICELRKAGYDIETASNSDGQTKFGRYILHGEPDKAAAA